MPVNVVEKVVKVPNRAEADRFFNYPYDAMEEILVNAVVAITTAFFLVFMDRLKFLFLCVSTL